MTWLVVLGRYWQALLGAGAALGVLLYGRHQRGRGAAEKETQLRADANARQVEAVTHATDAAARVRDADDPDELERLRARWRRP